MEGYTIDPEKISMDLFYELTRSKTPLPGRTALLEQTEERFQLLKEAGISHLGNLMESLKTQQKVRSLSERTGIPPGYLQLLRREAGSYLARPFPLSDFPGIPHEYVEVLKSIGIRHTADYFNSVQTIEQQEDVASRTGIPLARVKEIFALCDLSRITGVGGIFARIIYEAGIRSIDRFIRTDATTHHRKYRAVVDKQGIAAGRFSREDMQYCIEYAKVVREINKKEGTDL